MRRLLGLMAAIAVTGKLAASAQAELPALPELLLRPGNLVPECVTPGRMMAFLKLRNPRLNPRYGRIAVAYARVGEQLGIRWDFAFFQMTLETAALAYGKDVKPQQNNFAGIGATGGGVPGESFKDIETGVRAHLEHLLLYAGKPPTHPVAARTRMVRDQKILTRWQASLKRPVTYTDLTNKWAADHRYARSLAALAEQFRASVCPAPDPQPELVQEARRAVAKAAGK